MPRNQRIAALLLGAALIAAFCYRPSVHDLSALEPLQPSPQMDLHRPPTVGPLHLTARLDQRVVHLAIDRPAQVLRSSADLSKVGVNLAAFPICVVNGRDDVPGEGAHYTYAAWDGEHVSAVQMVDVPAHALPSHIDRPALVIDKLRYVLEVHEGGPFGPLLKSFPITLGRNPLNRKLIYDNSSTPEGLYHILGLQPDSPNYKAYDIDYPNALDRARYALARRCRYEAPDGGGYPEIGGEIQIHGGDIAHNSTNGCIALRHPDLDELYAHTEIAAGTEVLIVGSEITREMAQAAGFPAEWVRRVQQALKNKGFSPGSDGRLDLATCRALGRFQERNRLRLTFEPDAATLLLL